MAVLETFKEIFKYEDYSISNKGRVFSKKSNKFIKCWINNKGYYSICLCKNGKKKNFLLHRLIATAFIPNPNNLPMLNHKDENPLNNDINNLEWCTAKYNVNYGSGMQRRRNTRSKKVVCIEKNKIYDFIVDASIDANVDTTCIYKACVGKRKTAGGFHWKYLKEGN